MSAWPRCRPYCVIISSAASTATDVVAKAQAAVSGPELLRAMFDVGYFPPNTPSEPQR
jgi:hypothetical protein